MNILKRSLRAFSEDIRLQTFGRCGYNQIEVDVEYFRRSLTRLAIDDKTEGFAYSFDVRIQVAVMLLILK